MAVSQGQDKMLLVFEMWLQEENLLVSPQCEDIFNEAGQKSCDQHEGNTLTL